MAGSTSHRAPRGGLIERDRSLGFRFDGRLFSGHPGDTLASALLANGVMLMGRSFKYHRPRGPFTAGSEEPNALVELRGGTRREPNTRATTVELFDGLEADSQNRFPSLAFDVLSINDRLSPFLRAGFYYKTFMWPAAFWEQLYEPLIRRAAGLGRLSGADDPDSYEKAFLHTDLLVVGAGPAGLLAALTAARAGVRVTLVTEDFRTGGRLLGESLTIGDEPGHVWAERVTAELNTMDHVRVMARTTVFGVYDGGTYGALEQVTDHLASAPPGWPRQRLWKIIAKRAILASGAIERPILFGGNDRPGVMHAGAMRTYANRYGAVAGTHVALFCNNDDAWRTAVDLQNAGATITALIDVRGDAEGPPGVAEALAGVEILRGAKVRAALGSTDIHGLDVVAASGRSRHIKANALAVSGGWNPVVNLTCHHGAKPVWNPHLYAFLASPDLPAGLSVAGAADGRFSTASVLASAAARANEALSALGLTPGAAEIPAAEDAPVRLKPFWYVANSTKKAFVDFQNDVSVDDIKLSHQEGFKSVEHLKRYTTLGMATDQGKIANVPALALMAELRGLSIAETGTTTFRPPYTPVSIGAMAGRSRGSEFRPTRLTPSHAWAQANGAVFVETGAWLRAQWFVQGTERHWRESVDREVTGVRERVGICDVTTLGKIDVQGSDAAEFLDRLYANTFSTVKIGRARYGLMLREDGFVMDDGTCARLGEHHYLMTTTTANAAGVFRHMEYCRQVLWPTMDVQIISVTDQWAQFAVAGPRSRELLQAVIDPGCDISNDAFPYLAAGEVSICNGLPARLFRLSFSGELAYEIAVPTRYGDALVRALMEAGEPLGVLPYGTEALGVMRVEKGHPAGNELNGTTTAADLGLGRMVSAKKDCIGRIMSLRPGLNAPDRPVLVGFKPVDPAHLLTAGAHFLPLDAPFEAQHDEGYMTSVAYSPSLASSIGLGFIKHGFDRIGERVRAVDLVRNNIVPVEIVSAHFLDPEGERLRG
ncbi:MAG: sarcosine oxidase subunit alpha family protein [Gammaproteobacteria bacterium]|nr:sarcosine oxidase subunit alpha family protein [Gammaproteobacteria bacterium]